MPCVTLRNTIEHPETIDVGANLLAGTGCEWIRAGVNERVNAVTCGGYGEDPLQVLEGCIEIFFRVSTDPIEPAGDTKTRLNQQKRSKPRSPNPTGPTGPTERTHVPHTHYVRAAP